MRGIQPETTRIQTSNDQSNGIIERYKRLITKEEIQAIQPDTPIYKDKDNYLKLAAILLLLGLGYHYWDDISPIVSSFWATINIFRSRPDPNSDDSNWNISGSTKPSISGLKDWLKNKFSKKDKGDDDESNSSDSPIGLFSKGDGIYELLGKNKKGKDIDPNEISQAELERRANLEENLPIIREITGESSYFVTEANAVLKEMNIFNLRNDQGLFPSYELKKALYKTLDQRLDDLKEGNPILYQDLIAKTDLKDRIEKFENLDSEFWGGTPSPASNNYEEVAIAANKEKDVWSDKADTPPQVLSPLSVTDRYPLEIPESKSFGPLDLKIPPKTRMHPIYPESPPSSLERYFPEKVEDIR